MATAEVQQPVQDKPEPSIPDYLADPDAVLKDTQSKWRYGRAPDYSKTRKVYAESEYSSLSLFSAHKHSPCTTTDLSAIDDPEDISTLARGPEIVPYP